MCKLIWTFAFLSLGKILSSRIVRSYNRFMFKFWRQCPTVSDYTVLHSQQPHMRVPGAPRSLVLDSLAGACGFNLHFPKNWWCCTRSHVLPWHSSIFFSEAPIQNFCLFLLKVGNLFSYWDLRVLSYVLDTDLYWVYGLQVFPPRLRLVFS